VQFIVSLFSSSVNIQPYVHDFQLSSVALQTGSGVGVWSVKCSWKSGKVDTV